MPSNAAAPNCETAPPTERDLEVLSAPSLAGQFPVLFPNGRSWTAVDGRCSGCKGALKMACMRGTVTRPMPTVAVVEAIGVCTRCQVGTRFFYRLHDDLSISGLHGKGDWGRWQARPTAFGYVVKALRWLVGR